MSSSSVCEPDKSDSTRPFVNSGLIMYIQQASNPVSPQYLNANQIDDAGRELFRKNMHNYPDYICGFGAAVVNILVTFPINKIIFRQMLHGQNLRSATADLRAEGFRHLYRGVVPPLIQRSFTLSLMFGTFGSYHRMLNTYASDAIPSNYGRFSLAAFLAGSTEAILCPFERIQMLLQDDRKHHLYSNTVDAFKKLRVYGISEYYRGISAILLRNGPSNIMFFTLRDDVKKWLHELKSDRAQMQRNAISDGHQHSQNRLLNTIIFSDVLCDFITGSLIGAFISSIFYPINVVRTTMQTQQPGSKHLTVSQALKHIYHQRDGSFSKMYRGVHANYSRSFLSWGIINACYEMFHKMANVYDSSWTVQSIQICKH